MKMNQILTEEDSEDFSADEAQKMIPTKNSEDLVKRLMKHVRGSRVSKFAIKSHDLRRREGRLYCRVCMTATQEPDKILIFGVDWVQP